MRAAKIFYERDVRPGLAKARSEVSEILAGPGWKRINGYEKLGRVMCAASFAAALAAVWLLVAGFCVALVLVVFWDCHDLLHFLLKR